jgi:hypothetical protein
MQRSWPLLIRRSSPALMPRRVSRRFRPRPRNARQAGHSHPCCRAPPIASSPSREGCAERGQPSASRRRTLPNAHRPVNPQRSLARFRDRSVHRRRPPRRVGGATAASDVVSADTKCRLTRRQVPRDIRMSADCVSGWQRWRHTSRAPRAIRRQSTASPSSDTSLRAFPSRTARPLRARASAFPDDGGIASAPANRRL